ncbi:PaaI family thioesterase [Thalassobius sp. MITS945101]|uniref:PaaI family thioesterase n=1 Tax=Thalassobius sp. MITS945101 TaxID=3096994 RepID=UPI00399C39D8
MPLKMTAEELQAFVGEVFPQVKDDFVIEELADMRVKVRMRIGEQHLRPGGTVSGPSMFALADVSVYLAVMAMIGPKALAVTTNSSLDFMRKPASGVDLIGECRLLKLGKVLAVGDVLLFSEGMAQPVARASMTYSIPPR